MGQTFFSKYYLATPLFAALELYSGNSLRVRIPWEGEQYVYIYLAACFAIGGFFLRKPPHLNLFAIFESSINLMLLVLSVYVPIVMAGSDIENGVRAGPRAVDLIQFVLVGAVLLYGFYSNPLIARNA